jgi:hypothetical protein
MAALATPVAAEEFRQVEEREEFVGLVSGKALTRFGISLNVSPSGKIDGSAFGKPVTGAWRWNDGYFCRDLSFGTKNLGPNCQIVQVRGATLRFIADQGRGDRADLRLR